MKKITFLFLIFFSYLSNLEAQNTFDIVYSQNPSKDNSCGYFNNYFKNTPKEIGYSIKREGDKLYFHVTDKAWAIQLFKKSGDGVAIDVVSKSRYDCGKVVDVRRCSLTCALESSKRRRGGFEAPAGGRCERRA